MRCAWCYQIFDICVKNRFYLSFSVFQVRNGSMVACSASEVVNEITKLQGLSQEQKMLTSVNSRAIILNEHVPGEGNLQIIIVLKCMYLPCIKESF